MSSAKTYLFSLDTLKTMGQGALGAMTFGAYAQFHNNRMMELNNENIKTWNKHRDAEHTREMNEQAREMNILVEKLTSWKKTRKVNGGNFLLQK